MAPFQRKLVNELLCAANRAAWPGTRHFRVVKATSANNYADCKNEELTSNIDESSQ
jgi:hypothetical protein